ncbi:hypothetical protein BHF71_01645 [Vulcanibacillus modesticaldus]|uniref:Uncharacterized protein n=1 Tax=Vulcanibacillus modesticaldus TaxID=337097 RepID=A0A1D2YUD5_9BACI|nr:hypothetical protein [Vulcanibacillus modesticaldus]OEF99320.1 hypothetical protein BHF71_01645 [Vulcanibacillus modesticaldus]
MNQKIVLFFIIVVAILSFYIGMSYISTSTSSNYQVKLIEKYYDNNNYWGKFYDPITKMEINIKIEKTTWDLLENENEYVISFRQNDLFKVPILIEIKKLNQSG